MPAHLHTRSGRAHWSFRLLALAMPLLAAGCGNGSLIVLGERHAPRYRFDEPELLAELSAPAKTDNPTLSADLLQIYFTSERGGAAAEIWWAERSDPAGPFSAPRLARELNSTRVETSPILAPDALTLWFASDRAGGLGDLDVWVAIRTARDAAWSAPRNLPELSSAGKDIPRAAGQHDRVMPLGSDRDTRGFYQIYFAARSDPSSEFAAPERVAELWQTNASTVDGFLSDDGLTLFYVRGPAFGPADLFVAARRTLSEPFADEVPLSDLNTESDERDPWLSPDGDQLYFSSDRSGNYEIYVARVHRETGLDAAQQN